MKTKRKKLKLKDFKVRSIVLGGGGKDEASLLTLGACVPVTGACTAFC